MLHFQDLIDAFNTIITSYENLNKTNDTRTTLIAYLKFGIQQLTTAQTEHPEQDAATRQQLQSDIAQIVQNILSLFDKHVYLEGLDVTYNSGTVTLAGLKTSSYSNAAELITTHMLTPLELSTSATPETVTSRINLIFMHEYNLHLRAKQESITKNTHAIRVQRPPLFPATRQAPFSSLIEQLVCFIIRQIEAPSQSDDSGAEQSLNAWVLISDSSTIDTLLNSPDEDLHASIQAKITTDLPYAELLRHTCSVIPLLLACHDCQNPELETELTAWLNTLILQAEHSPLKHAVSQGILTRFKLSYSNATDAITTSTQYLILREQIARLTIHKHNLMQQHEREAKEGRDQQLKHYLKQNPHVQESHPPLKSQCMQRDCTPQPHPMEKESMRALLVRNVWTSVAKKSEQLVSSFMGKSDNQFSDDDSDTSDHSTAKTGYTSS